MLAWSDEILPALVTAYEALASAHNATGLTAPAPPQVDFFYGRPFRVLGSHRFVDACLGRVADERLQTLVLIGSIDQMTDSTDVLENTDITRALRTLYEDASYKDARYKDAS